MSATGLVGIDVKESHGVDRNALQSSYFLVCEDNRSFLSGIPTDSIKNVKIVWCPIIRARSSKGSPTGKGSACRPVNTLGGTA